MNIAVPIRLAANMLKYDLCVVLMPRILPSNAAVRDWQSYHPSAGFRGIRGFGKAFSWSWKGK
jgi:hypothetical protein